MLQEFIPILLSPTVGDTESRDMVATMEHSLKQLPEHGQEVAMASLARLLATQVTVMECMGTHPGGF
jgi:hypothetical protein